MITTAAYILFWVSLFLVIHSYCLYPIIVLIWSSMKRDQPLSAQAELPSISLLLAVHNEEEIITEKLENIRNLEFPKEKIEILIGSDGSSDATMTLLESSSVHTRIFDFPSRRGKAAVLNDLAAAARNEIIVFSDANTFYNPDALQKMALRFIDPVV